MDRKAEPYTIQMSEEEKNRLEKERQQRLADIREKERRQEEKRIARIEANRRYRAMNGLPDTMVEA